MHSALSVFRDANPCMFNEFCATYCHGPYFLTGLRAASREWRDCIPAPPRGYWRDVVTEACRAQNEHLVMDLLERKNASTHPQTSEDGDVRADILFACGKIAEYGSINLCTLMFDALKITDYQFDSVIITSAASAGRVDVCRLAYQQCKMHRYPFPLGTLPLNQQGAQHGHLAICEFALSIEPSTNVIQHWTRAFEIAAQSGHLALCKVARERGAKVNIRDIWYYQGHVDKDVLMFATECELDDNAAIIAEQLYTISWALGCAALTDDVSTCWEMRKLISARGFVINPREMFTFAALNDCMNTLKLAREWAIEHGMQCNYAHFLRSSVTAAASPRTKVTCRMMHRWLEESGASREDRIETYLLAFSDALYNGKIKIARMLYGWLRAINAPPERIREICARQIADDRTPLHIARYLREWHDAMRS